jgi:hypothetical protein
LAWNHFVHNCASADSDYLVFVDADVVLGNQEVIYNLLQALECDSHAQVSAGTPIKEIESSSRGGFAHYISVGVTRLRRGAPGNICGMLYCGRYNVLKSLELPIVLMGEDAFVRAMVVTSGFTCQDDPRRVISPPETQVLFESYSTFSEIMRNKTRRMIELTINSILYAEFWDKASQGKHAGELCIEWSREDPEWSLKLLQTHLDSRGRNFVPREFIFFQFRQLRYHQPIKRLALFVPAVATIAVNWIALRRANAAVRAGGFQRLWDKKPVKAQADR